MSMSDQITHSNSLRFKCFMFPFEMKDNFVAQNGSIFVVWANNPKFRNSFYSANPQRWVFGFYAQSGQFLRETYTSAFFWPGTWSMTWPKHGKPKGKKPFKEMSGTEFQRLDVTLLIWTTLISLRSSGWKHMTSNIQGFQKQGHPCRKCC